MRKADLLCLGTALLVLSLAALGSDKQPQRALARTVYVVLSKTNANDAWKCIGTTTNNYWHFLPDKPQCFYAVIASNTLTHATQSVQGIVFQRPGQPPPTFQPK